MNESQYLKERLDDQIAWYDRKSQLNQRAYKWLRGVEMVAAASIPFLAGYAMDFNEVKFAVGLLGVIVAVVAGLIYLYRFQELWMEYRTTCESLRHEKYLYLTNTDPYNVADALPLLVQRNTTYRHHRCRPSGA